MNFKSFIIGVGLALAAPLAAQAATLDSGIYDATDYDGSRSIWTPGGANGLVGGAHALWSFSGGAFSFNEMTGAAKLTAKATNLGDAALMFNVDLSFNLDPAGYGVSNPGYCQFADVDKGCNNGPYAADPSTWDYFNYVAGGTFTGAGALAGVVWEVSDNLMHKAQAGVGANALETGDNGFSMWLKFTQVAGAATVGNYTINAKGGGDINIDLSDEPFVSPVPLPAGVWLMLGALGALGALRRKV